MPCTVLVVSKSEDLPTKCVDGKPTLVYWNILGLCQSTRLALIAADVDFVDVRIDAGDPASPEFKKAWENKKFSTELIDLLAFPNLPYFLHPDLPANKGMVQSDSILRFIGTKYNMLGSSPALTDMYLEHLHDIEICLSGLSYGQGGHAILNWFQTKVPVILKEFGRLLASSKYLGCTPNTNDAPKPSVADWKFYVFLYKLTVIQQKLGNEMTANIIGPDAPWVKQYMSRIEEESSPAVKSYIASESYMKGSINNPHAKWSG